jgi:diamine N-acetyltransferase
MTVMETIRIRNCSSADIKTLVQLGIRTFRETFQEMNTAENMQLYLDSTFNRQKLEDEMTETGAHFFLAEHGDEAVGFAKVRASQIPDGLNNPRSLEIERIYIVRDQIGKGVGRKLMQTCIDHAARNNYEVVWLGVWEHNERAINFYTRWGFEKFGQHVFMLGTDAQTDFLMKKELN